MTRTKLPLYLLALTALAAAAQPPSLTGRWTVSADVYGTPRYFGLKLDQQGEKLTGEFAGSKLEGTAKGSAIHFVARDDQGYTNEVTGTIDNGVIHATVVGTDPESLAHPSSVRITATLAPVLTHATPQRHEF
ncbi:MAG TPA: acetamidase, partial [Thermoanaerobaculia bacterium]|nr:acetamidase [Thermoanaerobaculia bacterium]